MSSSVACPKCTSLSYGKVGECYDCGYHNEILGKIMATHPLVKIKPTRTRLNQIEEAVLYLAERMDVIETSGVDDIALNNVLKLLGKIE
jgi:hypothetical protein